jgi:hypothetical protein
MDQDRATSGQQLGDCGRLRRVPPHDPVLPELPDVAAARHGHLRHVRDRILGLPGPTQQPVEVGKFEPEYPELEALKLELPHLGPQQVLVPTGAQRQLVVRDDVCPLLGRGESLEVDARQLAGGAPGDLLPLSPQPLGGQQPTMASDYAPVTVQQDWGCPPEFEKRRGDLVDLALRVRPGVLRVGHQEARVDIMDRQARGRRALDSRRRAFCGFYTRHQRAGCAGPHQSGRRFCRRSCSMRRRSRSREEMAGKGLSG